LLISNNEHPYKYIKKNPMLYVKVPKIQENKKSKQDLKVLSLENFNKIIKRFLQGSSFYIPLQIAFNTGMRGGEVTALQCKM
jgi:integrase